MTHNRYQQYGGEDATAAAESQLLEANGNTVIHYQRHNQELSSRGAGGTLTAGIETVWSSMSFREVQALIAKDKPDVAHFHNTFPLISPAPYYACAEAGVPVVQTLHNYRLICPAGTFLRDGQICQSCLGRVAWRGAMHGCYRGSRAATVAVAAMLALHRVLGTWQTKVDAYIAVSEFARQKFIEGGLPEERIIVKPNFVEAGRALKSQIGDYALYVGRLSEEKGLRTLLAARERLHEPIPLWIAGDGPMRDALASEIAEKGLKNVELLGRVPPSEIITLMHRARFLVFPSIWFEGLPLTIVEAFACGLPVVASRLGTMTEIVHDGVTGLLFNPGDGIDLAARIEWAWNHPEALTLMGRAARADYEAKYTPARNYELLMEIYRRVTVRQSPKSEVPTPIHAN